LKRDVLSMVDLAPDLMEIIARASALKAIRKAGKPFRPFEGKYLAMIFEKPSTRTRSSFEIAMNDLGGHSVYLSPKEMQLGRGETVADTARVLSRYYDVIMYRAYRHSDMTELARWSSIPVINGLDDAEHPCQVTADLLTLWERWGGSFKGRQLAYIGDGNNVLASLMLGCAIVGLDFKAAIPQNYWPSAGIVAKTMDLSKKSGAAISIVTEPKDAAKGSDAIYTDVWVSMGDEAQEEKRKADFRGYQINTQLLKLAKPGAFAMHDLPAHRGLEITDEVMDGGAQAIWDQAENRLHAQKAILELVLGDSSQGARERPRSAKGKGR
jgi:ornithine carbamoyltransferase